MGSLVRELQAVLSVYLGIMVEGSVTGLSAVAIPAILRCSTSTLFRCDSISSTFPCPDNHSEPEDNHHYPDTHTLADFMQPLFHYWCLDWTGLDQTREVMSVRESVSDTMLAQCYFGK